jgi:hypothetical protein
VLLKKNSFVEKFNTSAALERGEKKLGLYKMTKLYLNVVRMLHILEVRE